MDFTTELMQVQSILKGAEIVTTGLTKINYASGKEEKIAHVTDKLREFFIKKLYVVDNKISKSYEKELTKILCLMIINTNYTKTELNVPQDLEHLHGIIPKLSTFLLARLCCSLNLCSLIFPASHGISIENMVEIFDKIYIVLKCEPRLHKLELAHEILLSAIPILSATEKLEDRDEYRSLTEDILNGLLNFNNNDDDDDSDESSNDDETNIYYGYCLKMLFDILLACNISDKPLQKFINVIISNVSQLLFKVSVTVFSSWIEEELNGSGLQEIVQEMAYTIVEKYTEYKPAKKMIEMAKAIAKKPQSLDEQIETADMETIISRISNNDQNVRKWFAALIRQPDLLQNMDALKCLQENSSLCTIEDVSKLLISLASTDPTKEAKNAVFNCASKLQEKQLSSVITRHFCQEGSQHNFENKNEPDSLQNNLVYIFNTVEKDSTSDETLSHKILLLMLENPEKVLYFLFNECLRNIYYTWLLKDTFTYLRELCDTNNLGVNTLLEIMKYNGPNATNFKNYCEFFNILLESKILTNRTFLGIIYTQLKQFMPLKSLEEIYHILKIFNRVNVFISVDEQSESLVILMLKMMGHYRNQFYQYEEIELDITSEIVDVFQNKIQCPADVPRPVMNKSFTSTNIFVMYYFDLYYSPRDNTPTLLSYITQKLNGHDELGISVSLLIQILPKCVTSEWLCICKELHTKWHFELTLNTLSNVCICIMLAIENLPCENPAYLTLAYILHNYAIVIQKIIQPSLSNEASFCYLINEVFTVLCQIPERIRAELGIPLVSCLSNTALKVANKNDDLFPWLNRIEISSLIRAIMNKVNADN